MSACGPRGRRPHREVHGRTPVMDGRGKSDGPIVRAGQRAGQEG
jgi:hypothetical protein